MKQQEFLSLKSTKRNLWMIHNSYTFKQAVHVELQNYIPNYFWQLNFVLDPFSVLRYAQKRSILQLKVIAYKPGLVLQ